MGGSLDLCMDQLSTSPPHVRNGKLTGLLAFGPERLPVTAGAFALLLARLDEAVTFALKDDTVRSRRAGWARSPG